MLSLMCSKGLLFNLLFLCTAENEAFLVPVRDYSIVFIIGRCAVSDKLTGGRILCCVIRETIELLLVHPPFFLFPPPQL